MGKAKNFEDVRRGSIRIVRFIKGKVHASLSLSKEIREGHFVVVATSQGWEPKRFLVELGFLHNPEFLKLLKQAEEEFGFSHEGALAIPCRPDELQSILG
ncbi:auxin-induced protein X10A-like [Mercurialis annua]|uniref:auxin-induced protein X10A-like n=1 Tax=Mercurialis annua TaxID=3986 RepID=UPI0021604883|nr:auxin-induced protein X10A-like [Mercurialis annua]